METTQLKVLLVDDDQRFLEVMKRSLESKNCLVKCASNQNTALSLLVNEIFHVAFIDCVLNAGDGTALIQKTKQMIGSSVEIIMMSGIVPEKSLSRYIDLGVCNFLSKPISDKEVEESLNQVKEKYIYGNKGNILLKLFSSDSSDIQNLKLLISLKKAKDYEFFLYLSNALSSNESLSFQFQFNNKKHKIICNKKIIVNYECDSSEMFLNKLLSNNYITHQEINQFRGQSQEECVNFLLKDCILSSGQISDIKYDMLIETLKEIKPGIEISLNVNLVSPDKESFLLLNQNEYSDLIFLFLKQKFSNQFFSLFDKNIMERHLVFKENLLKYSSDIKNFLADLKSGMKLKEVYSKYSNDKNFFYSSLLYILLKGDVYLSESKESIKYNHLFERYQSLGWLIDQIKKPEKLFLHLCALPEASSLTPGEIKSAYLNFIKHNHPDSFPFNLPKDILELIGKILAQMKHLYDVCCDPTLKMQEDKKVKQKSMEKEIILTEKKKICERHLTEEKYEKASFLITSVSQKVIDEEIHWQLLYLWLYFKSENKNIDVKTVYKYMKNIQKQIRNLQKDKLCHYVFGLYYESKQYYEQAKLSFEKAKILDPSFQPCYPAIKKCSLYLLEKKQKTQSFIYKFRTLSIDSFKKKRKKVS